MSDFAAACRNLRRETAIRLVKDVSWLVCLLSRGQYSLCYTLYPTFAVHWCRHGVRVDRWRGTTCRTIWRAR